MSIIKSKNKSILSKFITIAILSTSIFLCSESNIVKAQECSTNIEVGKVNPCDFLNVRKGPGVYNPVIGKTFTNSEVKVLEKNINGWYKIQLNNGIVGWVNGKFVNLQSSTQTTGTAKKLIDLAYNQQGKPYVWGASGPNAFDCSGFTSYVYKQSANITLPRVSREQANIGKVVSKNELQAGDLVFFNSGYGGAISHVGMYIGNSKFIHSPRPGQVVKIDDMNGSFYLRSYVTARRVI